MKKKLNEVKNCLKGSANKRSLFASLIILACSAAVISIFLAGCAKTEYPDPPLIAPPPSPKNISVKMLGGNIIRIAYEYPYSLKLDGIKGFLIYQKWYKVKKNIKFSCNASKLVAFQDLLFKKKFSLQYNGFFYNVNKKDLKSGYYVFCVRSEGSFSIKSKFSPYIAVHIKAQKAVN